MKTLRDYLEAHYQRYDSFEAAAEPLGISGSRYARAMKGEYSLDALTALRLADAGGWKPGDVLRAAKKHDLAALLDKLYGRVTPALAPLQEQRDAAVLAALPVETRKALRVILAAL